MAEKIKIIQRLARIGISIPFFLLVILIWSYLLIMAGKPKVVDPTQSMVGLTTTHCGDKNHILCQSEDMCHWDDSTNTCTNVCELSTMQINQTTCESNDDCKWTDSPNSESCSEDPSWHPFEVFCDAQATHVGQITPTTTQVQVEQAQATQPCPDAKTRYYCSSEQDKTCESSDKEFDDSASWCDVNNLDSQPASSGSPESSTPYEHALKTHCCKDKVYESNINYVGMVVYMLLTLPFVYFLIEKIIQVFINYTDDGLVQDDQFEFLGKFVSHNGGKILGICIFAYYIILPIFRFIFVSYKCEDIVSGSAENCGKPCTTTDECASVTGNGCILCVNNVCENPIFTDNTQGASSSNIQVSVCSVKSILDDLSDNDIDELYTKYVPSPSSSADRATKITAIRDALNTPAEERKATSEFYKFIPHQNLAISDAVMPFNVRIPNPTDSDTPISGFSYILNNYIQMEDYAPLDSVDATACGSSYTSEIDCNKNHNCKYVNGVCQSNACANQGTRYSLPKMLGINTTQQVNSIPLHNQVVRGGSTSDNTYPCNTVVIDNLQKIAAKADLSNNNNLINDGVKDWINEFELKRFECADKNGQCYMDDYICKTAEGVPIPLKYTAVPAQGRYTVGEISDEGCSSAMYPCIKQGTGPNPCTALIYNKGYLLEDDGGTCQSLVWTGTGPTGSWRAALPGDQPDVIRDMCVPNSITPGTLDTLDTPSDYTTIAGATAGDYVSTLAPGVDIDTNCKSVKRIPYSTVTRDQLSTANPYYRWSPVDSSDHTSCSTWFSSSSNACSGGKVDNHLGTYTTNENPQDKCCIDGVASTDNSLYVTASSVGAADLTPSGSSTPITATHLN